MKADLFFTNGEVITVDSKFTITDSAAIAGNRIMATGSYDELKGWIGESTEIIDLEGKSLLPGIIDSHLHIGIHGLLKMSHDVKKYKSIKELVSDFQEKVEQLPEGEWLRGWNFNDNTVEERRLPTKEDLDQISAKHPIYIQRVCGHIVSANSYALKLAGITKDTVSPDGGDITIEHGELNGVLKETASNLVTDLDQYSDEEYIEGLKKAAKDYLSVGITSVHDLGGRDNHMMLLQKAARDPEFHMRIYAAVVKLFENTPNAINTMLHAGILSGLGDEKFKIGPSKLFLDGTIGGRTAFMTEGYVEEENNKGISYLDQETLNAIMEKAHIAGNQLTAHAIGNGALKQMISCIDYVTSLDGRKDHRHRIEHAPLPDEEDMKKIKELGIVINLNPAFLYEHGEDYKENIGEERVHKMMPIKTLLEKGIMVCASSDSPYFHHYNPFLGMYELVNRKTKKGMFIGFDEKISIEDAIKIFTYNNAYASFEEHIKGSIEAGKLADLVVLDRSILNCPSESIKDIKVEMTIFDGKAVYENKLAEINGGARG